MIDQVAVTACHEFDLGRPVGSATYVARGAMGEIWKVGTDRGAWALKRLFDWVDAQPTPDDVPVQEAAIAAGIPLPAPQRARDGHAVVAVAGNRVRAYEWVDVGEPLSAPVTVAVAVEAGRHLGALHALRLAPRRGTDAWYTAMATDEKWEDLERRARDARVDWAADLAGLRPTIDRLRALVADGPAGPVIVCHNDYNCGNVLPRRNGRGLVVLDWENAGALAADGEVADALLVWVTAGESVQTEGLRAFIASYREAGGAATIAGPGSFATAVMIRLNFLAVMADQALAMDEHHDFAVEKVRVLLDGAITRLPSAIDGLLDALAALPSAQ